MKKTVIHHVLTVLLVGAVLSSVCCMPVLAAISDEDFKKKLSNEYDNLSNAKLSVVETSSYSGVALDSVEVRKLAGGTQTTTVSKVEMKKNGKILDHDIIKKVSTASSVISVVQIFFGLGEEATNPKSYATIEIYCK